MAEGGGLLNRYTVKSRIGGSNPPLSAILEVFDFSRWRKGFKQSLRTVNHFLESNHLLRFFVGGSLENNRHPRSLYELWDGREQPAQCACGAGRFQTNDNDHAH